MHGFPNLSVRTERSRGTLLFALVAAFLAGGGLLHAQTAQPAQVPTLAEQQSRLNGAKADADAAQRRSAALERQAAAELDEAAKARAQEAAAAARIQLAQADIAAAQARIGVIDAQLKAQRVRLAEKQAAIVNLVAALQSMARRPAVLALAQPGSTSDVVHVRAVLGSTLPVVEARTADVRAELERIRRLKAAGVAAVASLREGQGRLESERIALVRLEADHRLRSRDLGRSALFESDRAIALGEQARDIVDLMGTLGTAAATQGELQALPGPLPRPAQPGSQPVPAPADDGHPPPYRLPVAGRIVTGLGEVGDTGVRSRGLTLAVAAGSQVVAPAPGRVVFAGAFRDYGRVVILDHGQGWSSLITGIDRLEIRVGESVAAGTPIGLVGAGDAPKVTVELRRRDTPVDLTALLD